MILAAELVAAFLGGSALTVAALAYAIGRKMRRMGLSRRTLRTLSGR